MKYQLAYLTLENSEKHLKTEKELDKQEFDLINECNDILSSFNMFCKYFDMLEFNMHELINYINVIKLNSFKISNPLVRNKVLIEINRLMINFCGMFRIFLEYYERFIREVFVNEENGDEAKELSDFKKSCSDKFDNYFEYRFLYNLRHYIVHYKSPITKIEQNSTENTRHFYIDINSLKKWSGWKPIIKKDIQNLDKDIDVEEFMIKLKKILTEFKKEISFMSKFEVIGSINILSKYSKANNTPYIIIDKDDENGNRTIQQLFDEKIVAEANIQKLGFVSMSVWDKEKGFVLYDPYNLQFTEEEKTRFGFNNI